MKNQKIVKKYKLYDSISRLSLRSKKGENELKQHLIIVAIISIVLLLVIGCSSKEENTQLSQEEANQEKTEEKAPKVKKVNPLPEPEEVTTTISVGMIGDILLHLPLYNYENFDHTFEPVKKHLQSIDFLLANQESIAGGKELGLGGYPSFNSPSHIIRDLKKYGVHMVAMANNHTLDRGEKAIQNAIATNKEYDMMYVGAYASEEDRQMMRIVNVDGVRLGILNYTYGTNGIPVPEGKPYLVNLIDLEKMVADVQAIRPEVDVVIVSIHWGQEYHLQESEEQRSIAQLLAEQNVEIIFGHHPHVVQPYEKIANTHVYYSLGNFLSAQQFDSTNIGGIAKIHIEKTTKGEETVGVEVKQPQFFPTVVVKENAKSFQIRPLLGNEQYAIYSNAWMLEHMGLPLWE